MLRLSCTPADVRAGELGVRWNGPLPPVLAETLIRDGATHSSLHLVVIGGSHVITVDAPSGRFREEISCTAKSHPEGQWPLPAGVEKHPYLLETHTRQMDATHFKQEAENIAAGGADWLIVSFPGVGEHHLTALKGECSGGVWRWWTHHLYPDEYTIVSTRSEYRP